MQIITIVLILLIGGTLPAAAEPVSTAIGLTALIEGFGATAAVAGAIGGAIVGGAISAGISLVASLLQTSRGDGLGSDLGINSSEQRYTERQAIPFKRIIFGSAYVGGAVGFEDFKAPYFTIGLWLNDGVIAGIDKIWAGTNLLAFSSITEGSILIPAAVDGQPNYPARVSVSLRFGSPTQTLDPLLAATYPSLDASFRQRGIATAVFRCHVGANQQEFVSLYGTNGPRQNLFLLVRGGVVYDPRDPTQDMNDSSTWKWSNNASLIQAFYITRDYGGRIPMSIIDWVKVADAANYDDDLIGCNDGTLMRRYTIDGLVTTDQKPFDVMTSMLTANRGMILQAGGKVWVNSSKPKTPIATIRDAILAGGIEYRDAKPKKDMLNKVQARCIDPRQTYQTVDVPILEDTALIASDGEALPGTLDLPFTADYRTAMRLQKAYLATSRLGKTLTLRVDVTWLAELSDEPIGNAITFDSDLFSVANGTYLCTSAGFADDFNSIEIALIEYDASIENDWTPSIDERDFPLPSLSLS